MERDMESTAREAQVLLDGKRQAEEAAGLLRQVLKELGIRVGETEAWPRLEGRASAKGNPAVFLGSVPLETANALADALILACLQQRRRARRALGYDS